MTSILKRVPHAAAPATSRTETRRRPAARRISRWRGVLWVLPAFAVYAGFVLYPLIQTVQFSFYNWDGIGVATSAGFENYVNIFTQPALYTSIINAFVLIIFFTVLPVGFGLLAAALIREMRQSAFSTVTRVLLFLPQIIPLAGAAIAWTWMYSPSGVVNQVLRAVGLGNLAKPWLGDFSTALPAVGIIGTWVATGFCTILLLAGMGKIEPSLYEAARLDGAGRIREFTAITLPGLRREIVVCVTVTVISALASFDVIYISTQGGPGYQTMVPGLQIFQLTFLDQKVGQASALAVVLVVLVLLVILPIQRLGREK
jgi:raffinose/stachyose/melibiose transport system permease protein